MTEYAFPRESLSFDQKGMLLRDYFAGQALAEVASLITVDKPETIRVVADLAYAFADAMMKARGAVGG